MQIKADSIDEYLAALPDDRKAAMAKLKHTIQTHLPDGFIEALQYQMPGFVVPHTLYPAGYHCKPEDPLPFISIASQKNHIALYHMGIYADPQLLEWFKLEYPKHCKTKLDMGKSCIRFKHIAHIPYDLIAELATKMTVDDWIACYEKNRKK